MSARARHLVPVLALVAAVALLRAPLARAQAEGPQYVDDLERYERRIESLVSERVSALVPSQNFVLKVNVAGQQERVPTGVQPGQPQAPELPGFQRAPQEPLLGGEVQWRVDQIVVQLVLHEDLPQTDLQYLRTVVPILADFDPERGDRLDLRVVPQAAGREAGAPFAGPRAAGGPSPGQAGPLGLSWSDWIVLGVLALILLVLLIVLFRVFFLPRRPQVQQAQPAPGAAPPDTSRAAGREAEGRRRAEADARKAEEQAERMDSLRDGVVKIMFARPDLGRMLVQEWQDKSDKLTTLMHALGSTVARQALLPNMDRDRFGEMENTVLMQEPPKPDQQINVLRDASLFLLAQEFQRPEIVKPDPFKFLQDLSRGQVAHLIKDESVKIKAMVLSRLSPDDTARIMESLPKEMQVEVAVQIGNLQSFPLEMAENVARKLAEKARDLPDARTVDIEGPDALVELMSRASSETSRYLLQAMKSKDRRLSEEVERKFFLFEALPLLPDDVLPQVVRQMPSNTVIQALQGADQELQRKVIMAFPENARPGLVNTLRAARYDAETVQEARHQVIRRVQTLASQGRVDLKAISDAWQAGRGEAMAS